MEEYAALQDQLSAQSGMPLYLQLYQLLRRRIRSGVLKPGDMLPSEMSLMERYDVSRATVRQALKELVSDGLIVRERGRGTFVAPPSVEQNLVRIVSFTEDMNQRGLTPGTRLVSARLMPATEYMAEKLGIAPGEKLARIERLRLADGEPLSVEVSCLVYRYCPGVLEKDYTQESLRLILERQYGLRLARAEQSLQAVAADEELAKLLEIEVGDPLLFLERISYSDYDVPVEFLRIYHRGDRYTLRNELRG
ncbi:MAG: GntR family transcriptional regulator [Chloroflexota bacterium]